MPIANDEPVGCCWFRAFDTRDFNYWLAVALQPYETLFFVSECILDLCPEAAPIIGMVERGGGKNDLEVSNPDLRRAERSVGLRAILGFWLRWRCASARMPCCIS